MAILVEPLSHFTISCSDVSLSAGVLKTVLRIKAATAHPVLILGWGFYAKGIVSTDVPGLVRGLFQTTDGTFTAVTPRSLNSGNTTTINATAGHTATAEPTPGIIIVPSYYHPQTGREPRTPQIWVQPGERFAIDATFTQANTVTAWMECAEF